MHTKCIFVHFRRIVPALIGSCLVALPAFAADTLNDAIVGGKFDLTVRYRFEFVSQDNPALTNNANASTLRAHLGYGTDSWHGLSLYGALEGVGVLGPERYNSTINDKTQYPVVADPAVFELNQLYLQYASPFDTTARLGRQRITYDNHRWIGNVVFRQNEQTYDGLRLVNTSLPDFTFDYDFLKKARRIFGPHGRPGPNDGISPMNTHLFRGEYKGFKPVAIVGYAYLLDFLRRPGATYSPTDATASSATFGLRLVGEYPLGENWKAFYTGEYARQIDYADNPNDFGLNYYLIEAGPGYGSVAFKVGYEVLEGNGTSAVQTPLATGHAFQGWADQLLNTPANGIEDLYFLASATAWGVKFTAVYHDFNFENRSGDIGHEWDAVLSRAFSEHVTVELKVADYVADNRATAPFDTLKAWASVIVTY